MWARFSPPQFICVSLFTGLATQLVLTWIRAIATSATFRVCWVGGGGSFVFCLILCVIKETVFPRFVCAEINVFNTSCGRGQTKSGTLIQFPRVFCSIKHRDAIVLQQMKLHFLLTKQGVAAVIVHSGAGGRCVHFTDAASIVGVCAEPGGGAVRAARPSKGEGRARQMTARWQQLPGVSEVDRMALSFNSEPRDLITI